MFSSSVLTENKAMEERWHRRCAELYGERDSTAKTDSGIEIKPIYTAADIADMDYKDISLPGEYPFTRGHSPLRYQVEPWMMRTGYGYGTGDDTLDRRQFLENLGFTQSMGTGKPAPATLLIDLPTMYGYDADAPEARGRVGRDGMSLSTIRDLEILFQDAPLDQFETIFIAHDSSISCVAMYIAYAQRRGIPQEKLRLKGCNPIYRWWGEHSGYPPQSVMKLIAELMKYFIKHMPNSWPQALIGYNVVEAGGTHVYEVALTVATGVAIVEECMKVGLDPDDVARKFYCHDNLGIDFFENVAKYRAKRRMWATIMKERFGCSSPEALSLRYVPQNAGSFLTAQEPLNNIVRTTLMTLAGVLAGVDGIWTASYDEGLGIPTEDAARVAARVQQIIYHETNIPHVVDPLGGSYYVEWLTNKIEEEAYQLMEKMDELGGYVKCWEQGWIKGLLEKSAYERQLKIDNGERVVVGLNRYRLQEQPKVEVFKVDPKVEEEAIARVRKFRAERDNDKAAQALAELRTAAQSIMDDWPNSCGNLMPAMINAFRADSTLGETQGVLKEVLGYGYTE